MRSYVLVGQAPSPELVRRPGLWLVPGASRTADALRDAAGWDDDIYLRTFRYRTNVWIDPGHTGLLVGADRVRNEILSPSYAPLSCHLAHGIVILGARAAKCFPWWGGMWNLEWGAADPPSPMTWWPVSNGHGLVTMACWIHPGKDLVEEALFQKFLRGLP